MVYSEKNLQTPNGIVCRFADKFHQNREDMWAVQVQFTLEEGTKVQRGSRGIALFFP